MLKLWERLKQNETWHVAYGVGYDDDKSYQDPKYGTTYSLPAVSEVNGLTCATYLYESSCPMYQTTR